MGTLEKRIDALENVFMTNTSETTSGVFLYYVDARVDTTPKPVIGWKYNDHVIMRKDGETDDELNQRAFDEVKPSLKPLQTPVFFPILNEKDE